MQTDSRRLFFRAWILAIAGLATIAASAASTTVTTPADLRRGLIDMRPGDTLLVAPGTYSGNIKLAGLRGTLAAPITVQGSEIASRPRFQSGSVALRLTDCHFVRLRNLHVVGFPQHGIVIGEDSESKIQPCDHIILEDVTIEETGAHGSHDALRLNGVSDFIVDRCQFEAWGGSGIDLQGCQRGVIQACQFIGRQDSDQANGVLIHGGSSAILVQSSFFRWAGNRSVSIGSGKDLPLLSNGDPCYSASAVVVAGNRIFGSSAPVAWVAADGGHVHHNTIVLPHLSVAYILQESADPRYGHCRNGIFERNVVVVDQRVHQAVRSDDGTDLHSFVFRENAWFRSVGDRPIRLLVPETNGVMQVDPQITTDGPLAFRVRSDDPRLAGRGADAYETPPPPFAFPN